MWPVAPHDGFDPEPDYANPAISLTRQDPSFNEPDLSDKPPWLQKWFPTTIPESTWRSVERNGFARWLSVDDALKGLINDLSANGELSNTLLCPHQRQWFSPWRASCSEREAAGVRSCSARTLDRGSGIPGWNC